MAKRSDDPLRDFCDGSTAAKLLGKQLNAFHQSLHRDRQRGGRLADAVVTVGSVILYRRSALIRYRDEQRALAKVKAQLRRKLGKNAVK